jgi:hypothetical protein
MSITSLLRNFDGNPNIVTMVTTSSNTDITTAGWFTLPATLADIELLQNGDFQTSVTDLWLIYYATGIGFYTLDPSTNAFVALAGNAGLSTTLSNGNIFVGNASNVATGVAVSGILAITNAGVTSIPLPSTEILVGNGGGVAAPVTMSGDMTLSNAGVATIANGAITDAKVNASAAIAFSKLASLTSGNILVGSAGNVPTSVAMSGDATIIASGALTIANNAITTAKILNANVTLAKLAAGITPAAVIKFFGQHTTSGGSPSEAITVTGAVAATDRAFVQMVNDGTNETTVLEAVVTTDTLTVTFSADPGADAIINYQLIRAAS